MNCNERRTVQPSTSVVFTSFFQFATSQYGD